jgi:uncharacterized protein (TIGR02246 family)
MVMIHKIVERLLPLGRRSGVLLCLVAFLLTATLALIVVLQPTKVFVEPVLAATVKSEGTSMLPDNVRSVVERAAASWMAGDAKAFASLFTSDGELIVPGQRWVGREAIEKVASEFAQSQSQVNIKIQRLITDQQQAVVEWRWEETEPHTGKKTQADDAIVIDFSDDHIKRWREYIDSQTPQGSVQ